MENVCTYNVSTKIIFQNRMVTKSVNVRLICFIDDVEMAKKWFNYGSVFLQKKKGFTVLNANILKNILMKKDGRGIGISIGRTPLEAYLTQNICRT